MKKLLILFLLLLVACASPAELEPIGCPEDAKTCPDGTAVVRVLPDCEFAPCPKEEIFCIQDAKECPDGSYVSRVPPDCEFAPCPEPEEIAVEPAEPVVEETKPLVAELLEQAYETGFAFDVREGEFYVYKEKARLAYLNLNPVQGLKHEDNPVYFTDVYFDVNSRKAFGVCDFENEIEISVNFEMAKSKCKSLENQTFDLLFNDYYYQTPLDWLKQYRNIVPTKIVEAEQTMKIKTGYKTVYPVLLFEQGDDRTTIHVDKNTKLPLRVEVLQGGLRTIHDYTKIFFEVPIPGGTMERNIGEEDVTLENNNNSK